MRLGFVSEVKEGDLMRNWNKSGIEKEVSREKMATEIISIK
jgi:hypothetical protein